MSLDIAAALREQAHRVTKIAEKAIVGEVKQELASIAFALAQLAESLEREGRGHKPPAP
jgi:hypothetical protein